MITTDLKLRDISSHVMRHSYTSLILGTGKFDIKMISQSLGHSSIVVTNKYVRTLSASEMDEVSTNFYDNFVLKNQNNMEDIEEEDEVTQDRISNEFGFNKD